MRRLFQFDWLLMFTVLFLLGTGLLSLYSLASSGDLWSWSGSVFFRQAVFAVLGILSLLFFAFLDYRHIEKFSTALFFFTFFVLILVLIFGTPIRGTAGWLSLGPVNIQPVEGAKIVLILFLASFISKKSSELGEWVRIIVSLVLSLLFVFLVLRQPDLGSALVLSAIWGGMIIASGVRLKHILALVLLGAVLSVGGWFTLEEYQRERLEVFLHPEKDPQGSGYNVLQSMVAIGSGGLFGKGVGFGSQSQLNFLPEKHTDFIFAVIAEELGVLGAGLTLFAYAVLLYRVWRIGVSSRDNFGYFVALGAFILFFVQILVNIGMNVGMLPVTGIPAPFLSYGGSSLLVSLATVGILQSIARRGREEQDGIQALSLDRPSEIGFK